jgi:YVTN family beta-propeller protein
MQVGHHIGAIGPVAPSRVGFLHNGRDVPELREGDEFAGHRILGVAGRGGMGVVYRAQQLDLDRPVALKLIAPHLAEDPAFRERFMRESRAAASIDHPNVIPIYYTGEHDGALYIAMRYVEGSDMRTLVRAEGHLEPQRAARLVGQVAGALDAAHARGVVHRDVKPANVLLGAGDHAYLTDFGLTKHVTSHTGSTREGGWVGTLGFVAPEQIRGGRVDARADVYALGCVLYHALTGSPPYQRDSDEATLWAHLHDDPPELDSVNGVGPDFDRVLARAMAKEPDDRYPSAGDLGRAALSAAGVSASRAPERRVAVGAAAPGDQETVASPGEAATAVAPTSVRRRPWAWALAAVPVLALAAVAAIVLGGGDGGGAGSASTATTTATTAPDAQEPSVAANVEVGGRPNSVTVAAGSVWVMRSGNDRLAIVSTKTARRREARPRVGDHPAATAAGFGRLWAANQSGPALIPIGLTSLKREGRAIALPPQGKVVAVATGARAVWVGIRGDPGILLRIDPRTHAVAKRIELPDGLQNIAVGAGAVWVLARRANTLTRVDIRTGRQESLHVGSKASDVAVGRRAVWVSNALDDTVTRIDTGSLNTTQIGVGRYPQGVAVGGDAVWVANQRDGTLTRIDPETLHTVGAPVEVDASPYALDVDGHHVWVGSQATGRLQRIDF